MSKSEKRRFYGSITVSKRGQIIIPAIASYNDLERI